MEVLIETSWNVKTSPFIFDQVYSVLIETSWNVKLDEKGHPIKERVVLIETSWNVKFKLAKRCSSFYGY